MNQRIYVIIPLFIFLVLFLYFYIRKAYAIRRVCAMSVSDKLERLNQITFPFGFEYRLSQDIFTSKTDAWQRECGYTDLYDRQAPFFHMIFDCEPVYFDYNGSTWLIEFWKGQYGITTGCEIGVYKSDRIISVENRKHTLFHAVSDTEMPFLSLTLLKDTLPISRLCERHWWLTSFSVGKYTEPEALEMKISITFPSSEMCRAFLAGLREAGYRSSRLYESGQSAVFTFSRPASPQPFLRRSRYRRWIQLKNRILLSLFLRLTKPFYFTIDRLLLLYEYLPILFRHILKLKRVGKKRGYKYEH